MVPRKNELRNNIILCSTRLRYVKFCQNFEITNFAKILKKLWNFLNIQSVGPKFLCEILTKLSGAATLPVAYSVDIEHA